MFCDFTHQVDPISMQWQGMQQVEVKARRYPFEIPQLCFHVFDLLFLSGWTVEPQTTCKPQWFHGSHDVGPPVPPCGASSFILARSSLSRACVEVDFDPKRSRSVPGRDRMALSWPVPVGRLCNQQLGSDSPRTWPKHAKITKERNMALRGIMDVDAVHRIFQSSLSHKATPCPGPLFDVFSRWPRIWKCSEKTRIVKVEQCLPAKGSQSWFCNLLGVVVSWRLFFSHFISAACFHPGEGMILPGNFVNWPICSSFVAGFSFRNCIWCLLLATCRYKILGVVFVFSIQAWGSLSRLASHATSGKKVRFWQFV